MYLGFVEPGAGIGPATFFLPRKCSTTEPSRRIIVPQDIHFIMNFRMGEGFIFVLRLIIYTLVFIHIVFQRVGQYENFGAGLFFAHEQMCI